MIKKSDWGIIGMGAMGLNLSRNFAKKNISLSIYNRKLVGIEEDVAFNAVKSYQELENAIAFDDISLFVKSLRTPRKILLMVPSGKSVDEIIANLLSCISPDDIIIDGGNSHYKDTFSREKYLKSKSINFIGIGISGGAKGALNGPSIMFGGNESVFNIIRYDLEKISAISAYDSPCCKRVGPNSSGHFVKMVHNGIEYAEMQLIAECYDVMKFAMNFDNLKIASVFKNWSKTKSSSFLLEISTKILKHKNKGDYLIDKILDKASNKGTGGWASIASIELGVPSTMLSLALQARFFSFQKKFRIKRSGLIQKRRDFISVSIDELKDVYDFSRIINHHQGFELLEAGGKFYNWNLNLSDIACLWTNGCIISSEIMNLFVQVLKENSSIIDSKEIQENIISKYEFIKKTIFEIQKLDIPFVLSTNALLAFKLYTQKDGSGNIIQAQRDFFGSHGYQTFDNNLLQKNDWEEKNLI
jgi:6-phosphogluconate dehydrogenase